MLADFHIGRFEQFAPSIQCVGEIKETWIKAYLKPEGQAIHRARQIRGGVA